MISFLFPSAKKNNMYIKDTASMCLQMELEGGRSILRFNSIFV